MSREFAPGIKRRDYFGNLNKLREGQVLDYVIQHHLAERAGPHYDFRIGSPHLGMYSWATRRFPTQEGDRQFAARTNLHTYEYKDFEGTIPKGKYGAGTVKKHDEGKVIITNITPNTISFSIAHKKHPERYTLVRPETFGTKDWLIVKQNTPNEAPSEKKHFKQVSLNEVLNTIKKLEPGFSVQKKLDGALILFNIDNNGKLEALSHRISKQTGKPVLHSERLFGAIPHLDLPKEWHNTAFQGEVHGYKGKEKDKNLLENRELSGLLNASIVNTLSTLKNKRISLKTLLFDITKKQGKQITNDIPYIERRKMLEELIKYLPKNKFTLPEEAKNKDQVRKLLNNITSPFLAHKIEGVVVHPNTGTPFKSKYFPDATVYVKDIFPARKGTKYYGTHAGGFVCQLAPGIGEEFGVGTGMDDRTRKDMWDNKDKYIGRYINVHSHGILPSGKLRVGAFKSISEDYPAKDDMPAEALEYLNRKK